jgi:hypothetical protein
MLRSILWGAVIAAGLMFWSIRPAPSSAIMPGQPAPDVAGENWLNSKPLTIADLKGRVVLIEFWTYG